MTKMELNENHSRIEEYCVHFKAAGLNVDVEAMKKKFEKFDSKTLYETLSDIVRLGNADKMRETLSKLGINSISNKISTEQAKDEVKNKLNLSDIVEFENNHKSYFKFKDKEGNITITRNLGDDSKQLFLDILSSTSIADKEEGKENENQIFNYLKNHKLIVLSLKNSNNLSQEDNELNKTMIEELQKKYEGREIVYSGSEGIYIVKGLDNEKDTILGLESVNINGKRQISINQLEQKGYDDTEKVKQENESSYGEDISLEEDEDIKKVILDSFENNVAEDITIQQLMEKICEKYPNYKEKENLDEIVMSLFNKTKENMGMAPTMK